MTKDSLKEQLQKLIGGNTNPAQTAQNKPTTHWVDSAWTPSQAIDKVHGAITDKNLGLRARYDQVYRAASFAGLHKMSIRLRSETERAIVAALVRDIVESSTKESVDSDLHALACLACEESIVSQVMALILKSELHLNAIRSEKYGQVNSSVERWISKRLNRGSVIQMDQEKKNKEFQIFLTLKEKMDAAGVKPVQIPQDKLILELAVPVGAVVAYDPIISEFLTCDPIGSKVPFQVLWERSTDKNGLLALILEALHSFEQFRGRERIRVLVYIGELESLLASCVGLQPRRRKDSWIFTEYKYVSGWPDGRRAKAEVISQMYSECQSTAVPWRNYFDANPSDVASMTELLDLCREHHHEQIEILKAWSMLADEFVKAVYKTAFNPTHRTVGMSSIDYELCDVWANRPTRGFGCEDGRYLFDRDVHLAARLWSARAAEKSATAFYQRLGCQTDDVSVTQLTGMRRDWTTHDLVVDGKPYDVKNARRSFSSENSYTEHCIPAFKRERSSSSLSVTIVGVLSEYVKAEDMRSGYFGGNLILGELTKAELSRLVQWATTRFKDVLELAALLNARFFPGWLFEYPSVFYSSRVKNLEALATLCDRAKQANADLYRFDDVCRLLATHNPRQCAEFGQYDDAKKEIVVEIYNLNAQVGISRPTLFCLILGLMLEAIAKRQETQCYSSLQDVIFGGPNGDRCRPLGLLDTQKYLSNILEVLLLASSAVRPYIDKIKYFSLAHPEILRGVLTDGRVVTVYAYCGGWVKQPVNARCGRNPIVIGDAEPCTNPACGHLVCPSCGFCSKVCPMNDSRQKKVAALARGMTNISSPF